MKRITGIRHQSRIQTLLNLVLAWILVWTLLPQGILGQSSQVSTELPALAAAAEESDSTPEATPTPTPTPEPEEATPSTTPTSDTETPTPTETDTPTPETETVLPAVETESATAVTANAATISGSLSSPGTASSVQVCLEYGTDETCSQVTDTTAMSTSGTFSYNLQDLAPATLYYYRAKAISDAGESWGGLSSFVTLEATSTEAGEDAEDTSEEEEAKEADEEEEDADDDKETSQASSTVSYDLTEKLDENDQLLEEAVLTSTDSTVILSVPAGTGLTLADDSIPTSLDLSIREKSPKIAQNSAKLLSPVYVIGPEGLSFSTPATLSFNLAALSQAAEADSSTLYLASYDESRTQWTLLWDRSTESTDTFAAVISQAGQYALVSCEVDFNAGYGSPSLQIGERSSQMQFQAGGEDETQVEFGQFKLKIPQGVLADTTDFEITQSSPEPTGGMEVISLFQFQAQTTASGEKVSTFDQPLEFSIQHQAGDLQGIDLDSLRLYYLDEETREWVPVEDSVYDPAQKVLTASIRHFSEYGEIGDCLEAGPGLVLASQVDIQTGATTFSYPIELPPGPGGFQPSLQLYYNSSSPNEMKNKKAAGSWVGIGWSLNLGRIIWNIEHKLSDSEYFLELNGCSYELVDADNDIYFTQPETHYQITRSADNTWDVYDSSGNHYQFGGTEDSEQYYYDGDYEETLYYRWDLSLMEDTHRNQAVVEYYQDIRGSGSTERIRCAVPEYLKYNYSQSAYQVVVEFDSSAPENKGTYGYMRADNPSSTKIIETRQLDCINVKVSDVLIRKYVFSYTTTDDYYSSDYGGTYYSGHHELDSITQYGANGTSTLPSMSFEYTDADIYYYDPDQDGYNGNPGNEASLTWPFLTTIDSGYGGTISYAYTQKPSSGYCNWRRQIVTSRTVDGGTGTTESTTYTYTGDPQYFVPPEDNYNWNEEYRGFASVQETDAAGNYGVHYYHTTGDEYSEEEILNGQEYQTKWYDSTDTLLKTVDYEWSYWGSTPDSESGSIVSGCSGSIKGCAKYGGYWFFSRGGDIFRKYDATHYFSFGSSRITDPRGIIASNGKVYVADYEDGDITIFNTSGDFQHTFGADYLTAPYHLDISEDDFLYVTDLGANSVVKFDLEGNYLSQFSASSPTGIDAAVDGYLYVICGSSVIQYDTSGNYLKTILTLSNIGDVEVTTEGFVWVQKKNGTVYKYDRYGRYFGQFTDSNLNLPYADIVIDDGYIYANCHCDYGYGSCYWIEEFPGYLNYDINLDSVTTTEDDQVSRVSYEYDLLGNVVSEVREGDVTDSTDDITITRTFNPNITANILNKPASEIVSGADGHQETDYYYDGHNTANSAAPTAGDLTRVEQKISASSSADTYYTYDSYGNKLTETDPNENTTTWTYETTYYTYPATQVYPITSLTESYTYDPGTDNLLTQTDVNGQTTTYTYDTFKRLLTVDKPLGRNPDIRYSYNNWGTLASQNIQTTTYFDTSNSLWQKDYFDGLGRIRQTQNNGESGHTILTQTTLYNNRGLVYREYVPQDVASVLTAYSSPSGKSTTYTYDGLGRVLTQTNPDGTVTSQDYSTAWQTTTTGPRNERTTYLYDAFKRLTGVQNLAMIVTLGTYYPTAYDAATVSYPARAYASDNSRAYASSTGAYAVYGSFGIADLPEGATVNGLQVKVEGYQYSSANSFDVYLSYDGGTTFTSARNTGTMGTTETTVTLGGSADTWGHTWTAAELTDANFKIKLVWKTAYKLYLDCVKVTVYYAIGEETSTIYTYDILGNLRTVTDDAANETSLDYDWLSRKTAMSDPDMGDWSYDYDANGNLTTQTDALGQTITLSYDELNRLAGKSYSTGLTSVTYGYDSGTYGNGRRTSLADSSGSTADTYDARGRLTQEVKTISGTAYTTGYGYDGADRVTSIVYPSGETVTPTYNGRGLPETLTGSTAGTLVSSTLYNALGSLTSLTLGNSAVTTYGYYGTGGTNDTTGGYYGRLWEIKTVDAASTVLQDVQHSWDAGGNLTVRQDVLNSQTENFSYDYLNRLTAVSGSYTESYAYDTIGNITSHTDSSAVTSAYSYGSQPHAVTTVGSTSYAYDANGNMTDRGDYTQSFDAENRLSQVSTSPALYESYTSYSTYGSLTGGYYYAQTFTPQTSHTLTSFKMLLYNYSATSGTITGYLRATSSGVPTSTNLATTAAIAESSLSAAWTEVTFTFTSGYFLAVGTQYTLVVKPTVTGLRLRYNASGAYTGGQRYYSSSGSSWTSSSAYDYYFQEYGTITTSYVYDGDGQRVAQTVDGVTTVYPNQYYEKNLSTAVVTAHYYLGDKLIAVSLDGTLSYILQDHLGSTSTTLNSSGAIVATINYFSFGDRLESTGTLPTDKLFTGQRLDATGLYYYGARYYDPEIGRFISPDIYVQNFTNPQTLNRYSYCSNNPLKYTDPTGHFFWFAIAIALAVANVAATGYDAYSMGTDPSLLNAGFLALDFFDPSPVPWGAGRMAIKQLTRYTTQKALREATQSVAQLARGGIKSASLGNKEARKWYIKQLKDIPGIINKNLSLEDQAKQAYELRNSFKSEARDLMSDKQTAGLLDISEPAKTWEQMIDIAKSKGFEGDDIYQYIIESSQRSNSQVNAELGLIEGIDY